MDHDAVDPFGEHQFSVISQNPLTGPQDELPMEFSFGGSISTPEFTSPEHGGLFSAANAAPPLAPVLPQQHMPQTRINTGGRLSEFIPTVKSDTQREVMQLIGHRFAQRPTQTPQPMTQVVDLDDEDDPSVTPPPSKRAKVQITPNQSGSRAPVSFNEFGFPESQPFRQISEGAQRARAVSLGLLPPLGTGHTKMSGTGHGTSFGAQHRSVFGVIPTASQPAPHGVTPVPIDLTDDTAAEPSDPDISIVGEKHAVGPPSLNPNANMETAYSNVQAYLENLPEETDIPSELKTSLLRHQKQALRWLVRQEHRWQCAILADDMGLGKTIQTLALIAKKRENPTLVVCPVSTLWHWNDEIERHFKPGTFSVSIYYGSSRVRDPKVLRRQDVVLTTYGTLQSDLKVEVKSTTTQYAPLCLSDQDEFDSNSGPSKSTSVLKSVKWGRIVLDEAHLIKNHNTSTAKAVRQLDARTRICLTGTPIQNSLDDLYSLLLFLRYPDYLTYKDWKNDVVVPVRARKPQGLVRLQQVLRHLLLRRRKNQMLNGKPIIEIPEIRVNVELITMNEHETLFYRAAEQQSRDLFLQMLEQGESHVRSNYWHVLELLLRLRQACDHPFLVLVGMLHTKLDRRSLKTWNVPLLEDTFRNFVREFRAGNGATLNSFVESFQSTGSSSKMAEMCAICFEDLECPIISTKCQHVYCKSCIDDHMESETTCPACSAVLHPRDLRPLHEAKVLVSQAASTNSAVSAATPLLVPVLPRHLEPSSPTRLTLTVESWKDQNMHVQPNTSLLGESTPPATEVPPAFKTRVKFASSPEADLPSSSPPPPMSPLSPGFPSSSPPSEFGDFKKTFKVVKPPSDSVSPRQTPILNAAQTASSLPTAVSRNVVRPGLFVPVIAGGKDQPVLPSRVPTAPKIPAPIVANTQPITPDEAPTSGPFSNATAAAAPDDNKPPDSVVEQPASPAPPSKLRDRGTQTPTTEAGAGFRSSTKLDHLIRYLQEHTVTEKAVVYSQFVCYLDLVEAKMRAAGLVFVRLDGSMSAKERQDVIRRLGEDKRVRIMLVSLRAGGLGINLTAASRVILLDPWWNPATEQQAIDRVHRIGQIRPVHVVKYIFTDTIEERILKLQQHKQAVADAALADKDTTASGTMLSVSDLRQLFRVQM